MPRDRRPAVFSMTVNECAFEMKKGITQMKKTRVMIMAGVVTATAWAGDVYVAAGAGLMDVLKAVEPLYGRTHPGVKLTFVYGATGLLRTQVLKGVPCDVFIAPDRWFGGTASNVSEVVAEDSVKVLAANTLVAVAGKGVAPKGDSLAAWLGGANKVGIGNPASVPAGRYAKTLLEQEKLWVATEPKFVFAANVREVLMWLRQGAVDVGFVYGSDVVAAKDPGLKTLAEYDAPGGALIEFVGGVARNAKAPAEARAFLEFLRSPEAVDVFRRFGFRMGGGEVQ